MKLLKRQIFVVALLVTWAVVNFAQENLHHDTTPATQLENTQLIVLEQKLEDEIEQLAESEAYLKNLTQQKRVVPSDPAYLRPEHIEQAAFNVSLAEIQVEKISLLLSGTQKDFRQTQNTIDQYEKQLLGAKAHSAHDALTLLEERLKIERQKLAIEQQRVEVLKKSLVAANSILSMEQQYLNSLSEQARVEQVAGLWESQQENETKLLEEQKAWEAKLKNLRTRLEETKPIQSPPTSAQRILQDQIVEAEEYIQILKIRLNVSRAATLIQARQQQELEQRGSRKFLEVGQHLKKIRDDLVSNAIVVENKLLLLQRQIDILKEPGAAYVFTQEESQHLARVLDKLKNEYETLDTEINELMTILAHMQNQVMISTAQTWKTRQRVPLSKQEWMAFAEDLLVLPKVAYQSLLTTYDQLVENLSHASAYIWGLTFGMILAWAMFWIWVGRVLEQFLRGAREEGLSFSANALVIFAQLIYRNVMGITVFGALMILLLLLDLSASNLIIPISLGAVWFLYKIAIGLARIYLFENVWDLSGKDVNLYRTLRWSLGIGGIVVALTVLAHQLPIPLDIAASFDRLFMLVLLAVSVPLLRNWRVLPNIFAKEEKTRPYVRKAVFSLGFLIPLTIFSNAIIGLIGYVTLAWRMWIVEAQFLFIFTLWVLARGIIGDVMESIAKYTIRNMNSGWVWTEAILKPLHKIINIVILLASIVALFYFIGLNENQLLMEQLRSFSTHEIFTLGETQITATNIIQFIVLLVVIRWAAKWSREFSYRFIFSRQKDKGVRNSLSVFTQYAIVIIGAFIILKVIGIDLTTITVVLGALAVGIGFGLQNIANNLVSGVLLLVERPFREGDIISVGPNEGEVMHIGMRATTIRTWDNMDVIIPNAETVSQSLMNWTYQDQIVRTTFMLRTGFTENPAHARALIMQTIRMHSSILDKPEPSVLLTEFGESALMFQVRYYVDVAEGEVRPYVKSEVLLRLWEVLRAAGINIPYTRSVVELCDRREA
jgi:potassium efflux system protein